MIAGGALLSGGAGCNCIQIHVNSDQGPQCCQGPGPATASAAPRVSGGNFVPVQAAGATQPSPGKVTVCGTTVQAGTFVELKPPNTQAPGTGDIGFTGSLYNNTTSALIPNSDFVLLLYVNSGNNGCATNIAGDSYSVGRSVTAPFPYRFTVYWKAGRPAPPTNHTILLQGHWTQ